MLFFMIMKLVITLSIDCQIPIPAPPQVVFIIIDESVRLKSVMVVAELV